MPNANMPPRRRENQYDREYHPRGEYPVRPRRSRMGRFFRGYLMLVGALTTLAVLVLLLVRLFVEIEKWVNPV